MPHSLISSSFNLFSILFRCYTFGWLDILFSILLSIQNKLLLSIQTQGELRNMVHLDSHKLITDCGKPESVANEIECTLPAFTDG